MRFGRASPIISIVPVVIYTEILSAKHTQKQQDAFNAFLLRSSIERVDGTFEIARKAEEVRSRGITSAKKASQQRKIKTPDATIIATAIVQRADALHSLEPKHHSLSGSPMVDGLKICLPVAFGGQKGLLPPST
jgi:hypothetical protein